MLIFNKKAQAGIFKKKIAINNFNQKTKNRNNILAQNFL